ncbi:MAG: hypothetical protein ACJ764_13350 [Solirubrobacteraceae bacterium]
MRRLALLVAVGAAVLATDVLSQAVPAARHGGRSRAPATLPRVHRTSLRYLGAFRLPAPQSDRRTFDYGGTALAYNPGRNSLFAVGHDWYQLTAEVSIPQPRRAAHVAGLPRASYLQRFVDATRGKLDDTGGDDNKIGGQLVYRGRLYGSVYVYYDATGSQVRSHWARGSTSLRGGRVRGLFGIGHQGAGFVSGYMALIPRTWRRALGGPVLTGNCCIPIISRTSYGPAAFAFDPTRLAAAHPTRDRPLVYYPQQHPTLGPWDTTWSPRHGVLFNGATSIRGVVFPRGTRSVLFFGTQGVGRFCYGEGTSDRSKAFKPTPDGTTWCYDPDNSSKGTHGYPYVGEVWAYDARSLAAVVAGRRRPWRVRPYATWRLSLPYSSPQIGGAAYDASRRLIYVSQQYADGAAPVIDVFRIR